MQFPLQGASKNASREGIEVWDDTGGLFRKPGHIFLHHCRHGCVKKINVGPAMPAFFRLALTTDTVKYVTELTSVGSMDTVIREPSIFFEVACHSPGCEVFLCRWLLNNDGDLVTGMPFLLTTRGLFDAKEKLHENWKEVSRDFQAPLSSGGRVGTTARGI